MDGPAGCYAKWNKSDKESQIPRDFTFKWNLPNKISEQTKQKQIHKYREKIVGHQMGGGLGG